MTCKQLPNFAQGSCTKLFQVNWKCSSIDWTQMKLMHASFYPQTDIFFCPLNPPHLPCQKSWYPSHHSARRTCFVGVVGAVGGVRGLVLAPVVVAGEGARAQCAAERAHVGVRRHVLPQVVLTAEHPPAHMTPETHT